MNSLGKGMSKHLALSIVIVLIICAFVAGYLVAPHAQVQPASNQTYTVHGAFGGEQYRISADGTYIVLYNLTINGYTSPQVKIYDDALITKLGKFTPISDPMAHPLNTIKPGGK